MNKKGLSLIEIFVSIFILAFVMVGLANLFVAGKRIMLHSHSRMAGGEFGKLFLDPLHISVRQGETFVGAQDGWGQLNNALSPTGVGAFRYCDSNLAHTQQPAPFCPNQVARTINNIQYSAQYEINPHPQNPNIRRVMLTVSWIEPQP